MMQPEILESPWSSFYLDKSSNFDHQIEHYGFQVDAHMGDSEFNSLFSTPEDTSSEVSSFPIPSKMFINDQFFHEPLDKDPLQLPTLMDVYDLSVELDDYDLIMRDHQVVGIQGYSKESEGENSLSNWSPSPSMNSDLSSDQKPLTLPQQGIEIENQVSLPHMLEALGEAMYKGHKELVEVISRCMKQKVSPIAEKPLARLAFYLCEDITTKQGDCYLTHEASKNFEAAFRAFYQGLPHGKVAHFVANLAILEAMPQDVEVIHIVDFDMGEGSQWPPMIEALATLNKTLKLTSIKWGEESFECASSPWKYEEIRRELFEYARSCGLKLKMEEKGMGELGSELKRMNKRSGRGEFLAFNCMVGFPHMGRGRSRRLVMEFLNLIKSCGNKGIVIVGDGRVCEKMKNELEFKPFFDGHLLHYQALLESIESHFPTCLLYARTAIECLFVAPYVSSLAWLQKWEEIREDCHLEAEIGLEGCKLNKTILMEVKEMLSGSDGSYQAKIEGHTDNELVLEWKGTQLVRVSSWRN
ncbi:nodulation-signaling pathway 2 protein-like [Abrus precatorius]|uniref:Nodulation-signaling pathway 2 protein-like n=1 Tax=Abrus precatorius TaxID=3816 RepID=A0A8B8K1C6_ABRPR|nr:nodulation-signaling pathway 2 protein-like [Abrus precatorius]